MIKSVLRIYKKLILDSEGCISILNRNNFFRNKKIKIFERDLKFFQKYKKNRNIIKKKINYRTKLF